MEHKPPGSDMLRFVKIDHFAESRFNFCAKQQEAIEKPTKNQSKRQL